MVGLSYHVLAAIQVPPTQPPPAYSAIPPYPPILPALLTATLTTLPIITTTLLPCSPLAYPAQEIKAPTTTRLPCGTPSPQDYPAGCSLSPPDYPAE